MDFIVTGLPRSRTAWVANYLTYGDMFCLHDALVNWDDLKLPDVEYAGIADSGASLFQDNLSERFPDAKWIIIERNYTDVQASLKKMGLNVDTFVVQTKLEELRGKKNPLVVPFATLDESIKDIAKYINPDWQLNQVRHEMLLRFNIQVTPEQIQKDIQGKILPIPEPIKLADTSQEYLNLVREMCGNEPMAFEWFQQLVYASLTWDHLKDGDAVNMPLLDRVMTALLTEWPNNPFLKKFSASLTPTMVSSITAWKFSYHPESSRDLAYSVYSDVPAAMAFCIGGNELVDYYIPKIRELVLQMRKQDDLRDGGKK